MNNVADSNNRFFDPKFKDKTGADMKVFMGNQAGVQPTPRLKPCVADPTILAYTINGADGKRDSKADGTGKAD